MDITCLVFAIIFIICSFMFLLGKGYVFIPNWKNLSEKEKEEIPLVELSRNMGIILGCCSLILLAGGLFRYFREHYFALAMVIWLVASGIDVYFIEKGYKIKK